MKITVTILTKNSELSLAATLESVKEFDEVVILDTGSTDQTLAIAQKFSNVKIFKADFCGFGKLHNLASKLATHEWILSLDSDETLSLPLAQEILSLSLNEKRVYEIERHNYFNNKHMKCCSGWHPDWIVRLYSKKMTHFSDDEVHEKVVLKNLEKIQLTNPILHTPFRTLSDFLVKTQTYSTLFAKQNQGKKKASFFHALFHGAHAFIKSYFLKRGFLGGKEGFIISLYNAECTFYKYAKLAELNCILKHDKN